MATSNSVAVLALQEGKDELLDLELFWCSQYMVENHNSSYQNWCGQDRRYTQKAEATEWLWAAEFPEVGAKLALQTSESTRLVMSVTQVAGRRCLVTTMSCNL